MKKHYGKLVNQIIREKGHTFQSIAKNLDIDKKTVLSWLREAIPPIAAIDRIGKVIVHNFAADFPELYDQNTQRPDKLSGDTANEESEKAFFREKYIALLEKYNVHLLKIIQNCRAEYGEACCRT
ncbi:MAG: hypothetical protein JKY70_02845 [Mucilaginibacter sp.]|nr:hypothetical protein [Mucilaginibacter sp.]